MASTTPESPTCQNIASPSLSSPQQSVKTSRCGGSSPSSTEVELSATVSPPCDAPVRKILSPTPEGWLITVSPSMLNLIRTCPRKAYYRYILRRVPNRPAPARDFGKVIHSALEVSPINAASFGEAIHASLSASAEWSPERCLAAVEKAYEGVTVPEDDYRNLGRAREVVTAYLKHWKDDALRIHSIEQMFRVPLGVILDVMALPVVVMLEGRIDKMATTHKGTTWIVDHKTTAREGEGDKFRWENNAQFKAYVWAAQTTCPEANVQGVIVDRIIVRPPVQRESNKTKPRNDFNRIPVRFERWQLDNWRTDTLRQVATFIEQTRDEHWPMNDSACSDYGGCDYWSACMCEQGEEILGGYEFDNYVRQSDNPNT